MMNLKTEKITDIFFDLDHTLWDFDKNSGLAFELVFQKHKIPIVLSEFLAIYEPINLNYWRAYREDRVTKEQLRRGRLKDSFDKLNREMSIDVLDAMAISYIDYLPENNFLLDGALDVLDHLSPNYNLHIITNGFSEVQAKKMARSGLSKYFKTVTSSEEVGVKKPNPKVFQVALDKAETLAEKSVMIGDSFEADVIGAQNTGIKPIFYNYRNDTHPKDFITIDSLIELKQLL